jgi:cation diffusion facilitator family transporter
MNENAYRATVWNIVGNTALFILKITAGLMSGSIALISDALNSFTDIISSIAVFICVRISGKQADEGHPFGHSRAEPIAGIIVAILAGILGFELIRSSFERLFTAPEIDITSFTVIALLITIVVKLVMSWYFRRIAKAVHSSAIMASSVDSLMDVFVSVAALIGVVGAYFGLSILDPLAGFVISFWIIYTGYKIGVENIDYLMGSSPGPALMEEIKNAALGVDKVKGLNTVRAHYVGNFIHVEIHIEVDKDMSTGDAHAVSDAVEVSLDNIDALDRSFVHIDPV